jgi:hypothetical protein
MLENPEDASVNAASPDPEIGPITIPDGTLFAAIARIDSEKLGEQAFRGFEFAIPGGFRSIGGSAAPDALPIWPIQPSGYRFLRGDCGDFTPTAAALAAS